jgi:hypothetical protein
VSWYVKGRLLLLVSRGTYFDTETVPARQEILLEVAIRSDISSRAKSMSTPLNSIWMLAASSVEVEVIISTPFTCWIVASSGG